ncbi:Uncharacterised protein [Vibrio cholerae]|nr:Uncharacterised protein [Vibrio cholerae]CSH90297.1 Uncharacterised protein [Vibrio cholerae]
MPHCLGRCLNRQYECLYFAKPLKSQCRSLIVADIAAVQCKHGHPPMQPRYRGL